MAPHRVGWAYLRPDQLFGGGMPNIADVFDAAGTCNEHLLPPTAMQEITPLQVAALASGSIRIQDTKSPRRRNSSTGEDMEPNANERASSTASFNPDGHMDGRQSSMSSDPNAPQDGSNPDQNQGPTDPLDFLMPPDVPILPPLPRFKGIWLQLHRY